MKSSDAGKYLTIKYDGTKPAGSQCDMTVDGTKDKSKATPFKFEQKGTAWIVSVDCDHDGKWTSFLSEDPADLIQPKEKDKTKVKRQRWSIKCTGGKCTLKNKQTSATFGTLWTLDPVTAPAASTTPSKTNKTPKTNRDNAVVLSGDASYNQKFPSGALDRIIKASGLTLDQIDKIMMLIMQFEQSDTRWWLYYGYCRALSYDWNEKDRGITLSLYGATTNKGSSGSDGYRLVKAYGKTLQQMGYTDDKSCCQMPGCKDEKYWTLTRTGRPNPNDDSEAMNIQQLSASCPFCKTISGLNDDPAWRTAVWKAFTDEYWLSAIAAVKASKLPQKAATYGFLVDWALNEGAEDMKKLVAKTSDVASAVAARAKSGKCCNDGAKNAENRAKMWGEAIASNPDLTQSVDPIVAKYKPSG